MDTTVESSITITRYFLLSFINKTIEKAGFTKKSCFFEKYFNKMCIFAKRITYGMVGNGGKHILNTIVSLYRRRNWLVLLANSYVQNIEVSEDIVSDSFISLMDNIDKLDEAVLKSYLVTTVKNKCLNWLKRKNYEQVAFKNLKVKAVDAQNIAILENDNMDFRMFNNEIMRICQLSLEKSGHLSSQIFIDRLNGLSYKDIAQKYNIQQRQVSYEISKILSILKVALKDYLPIAILFVLQYPTNPPHIIN